MLAIGETLLTPKHELPDIKNQASVKILFDSSDPDETDPAAAIAQLIDPMSDRSVPLVALPTDLATSIDGTRTVIVGNSLGTKRLPFILRIRVTSIAISRRSTTPGHRKQPLLLPNVMSAGERDTLLELSSNSAWLNAVNALYFKTRNPPAIWIWTTTACPITTS